MNIKDNKNRKQNEYKLKKYIQEKEEKKKDKKEEALEWTNLKKN